MIALKEGFKEKDARTVQKIREVFSFQNRQAPYAVMDANYWLFGELPENIPADYCGDDPSVMMNWQIDKIKRHYNHDEFKEDCYYGFLMPWFGTGVLASGFGTKVEMLPRMDPAVCMSEIKAPEEVDALRMPAPYRDGLMPRVLKQIDYFKENCDLPIGVTDCQGPLTTALSIIGYENFMYWMYDYPDTIHKLMDMCTDALIDWVKLQKKHIGVPDEEVSFIIGARMPQQKGAVWIADDDSVIMPEDLFAEFVKPYNERLLMAFGGGGIHYCGNSNQNIKNYMSTKGLSCLHNFHLDNFAACTEVRNACFENGVVYYLCDFVPADDRLEDYFDTVYKELKQEGMMVLSCIEPAIALIRGKYESIARNREALALRVGAIIEAKKKRYF